ncbi:MAG: hypothetical protein GTN81_07700 [Proteobacteria bacterium]|nr:hypothetical protein [Pseudomonadota bacterium]
MTTILAKAGKQNPPKKGKKKASIEDKFQKQGANMFTQEETKELMRSYDEIVLMTPYGEIHVCGNKAIYEERVKERKAVFSPSELALLSCVRENLEAIIKVKLSIPGSKIKEIVPAGQNRQEETKK